MKEKRKLNVKLLNRIKKHILEEPRRFFMSWIYASRTEHQSDTFRGDGQQLQFAPCGTAACIAGWANILSGAETQDEIEDLDHAREIIGKDRNDNPRNGDTLFDLGNWPQPLRSKYETATTPKQRAKIACARIDYLIKTGE